MIRRGAVHKPRGRFWCGMNPVEVHKYLFLKKFNSGIRFAMKDIEGLGSNAQVFILLLWYFSGAFQRARFFSGDGLGSRF